MPVDAEVSREFAGLRSRLSTIEGVAYGAQELLMDARLTDKASNEAVMARLQSIEALLEAIADHIGLHSETTGLLVDGKWDRQSG